MIGCAVTADLNRYMAEQDRLEKEQEYKQEYKDGLKDNFFEDTYYDIMLDRNEPYLAEAVGEAAAGFILAWYEDIKGVNGERYKKNLTEDQKGSMLIIEKAMKLESVQAMLEFLWGER